MSDLIPVVNPKFPLGSQTTLENTKFIRFKAVQGDKRQENICPFVLTRLVD